jgi:glycosyltransferase involved in cell wall biosynthesis
VTAQGSRGETPPDEEPQPRQPVRSAPARVTVFLTTYNHEPFIVDALETVLGQRTDFEFAVVVLEDCSTDRTREILELFHSRHPERLRLVLAERNLCSNAPLARELAACPSPYAAFLDGDDFWSSPHKLQRQVDFLDAHPDCAICCHEVTILHEDGRREGWMERYGPQKPLRGLAELLTGNFIPGCSAMVRRALVPRLPAWFDDCSSADSALYILYAQHGDIGYLPQDMGVYRLHRGGIWASMDYAAQLRRSIDFYEDLEARLEQTWHPILHRMLAEWRTELAALGPEPRPSPWTPVAQPLSAQNGMTTRESSDPPLSSEGNAARREGAGETSSINPFEPPAVATSQIPWIPSRPSRIPAVLRRTGGLELPTLNLRLATPSPGGSCRVEGTLVDSVGRGIREARVELRARARTPGIWTRYSRSGLVPPGATHAVVGIRVNVECGTPGESQIAFQEARYVESAADGGGPAPDSVLRLDPSDFPDATAPQIQGDAHQPFLHLRAGAESSILLNSRSFPVHVGRRYDLTVTAWVSPASGQTGCFAIIFLAEREISRDVIRFVPATLTTRTAVTTAAGTYEVDLDGLPRGELAIEAVFAGTETCWPARAEQVLVL